MNQSEIFNLAGELFKGKLDKEGDGIDLDDIKGALGSLMSDGNGQLDLGSLLGNMNSGSMMDIASSWLGDGDNKDISSSQLGGVFDAKKLSSFASQLGISEDLALNGLTKALPSLVDKSSSGGSLLDSLGGMDNVMSMAGKLFGR